VSQPNEIVIEAGKSERHYWRDLWRYRELFYFLAWRDILIRYKQTTIGITWALIRPLLTIVVFTVIFGKLARLPSGGIPYSALVLVGMIPWQFFASSLNEASLSLANKENIITKIYFPRLIIPVSGVVVNLVELSVGLVMLLGLLLWQRTEVELTLAFLPLFLASAFLLTLGCSIWIAALCVRFKDFRQVVPFTLQLGLYVSPIAYSSTIIPEDWRAYYFLNPISGIVEGMRWAIFPDHVSLPLDGVVTSIGITLWLLLSGIAYFRKVEKRFAETL
jgi:lipopolysaccharide transport system permease protein